MSNNFGGIETVTLESGATLEINFEKKLGEGAFGVVYSGKYRSANNDIINDDVAIKIPIDPDYDDADIHKETQMNLIQGICYEQSKVGERLYIVMPNLGKPLPNLMELGKNLTDTIVEEPDVPSIEMDSLSPKAASITTPDGSDTEESLSTGTMIIKEETDTDLEEAPTGTMIISSDTMVISNGTMVVNTDAKESNASIQEAPIIAGTSTSHAFSSQESNVLSTQPKKPLQNIDGDVAELTLDLNIILDIFTKMAREVERAHNNGLLHLDLKGENFLYNKQTGDVKLIDFGISHFLSENRAKKLIGTINWIPPELVVRRRAGTFSTEQDIYSLGRCYVMSLANQLLAMNNESISQGPPIPQRELDIRVKSAFSDTPQLEHIQFNNPNNNPEITAINQLLSLMHAMTEINPEHRPPMNVITQQLTNIHANYIQAKTQENQFYSILKDLPFQGSKVVDHFLARNAIHDFNRNQPRLSNGDKAPDLAIPNNTDLDSMIKKIRAARVPHAQASTSSVANQSTLYAAPSSTSEAKMMDDLIKETIAKIEEYRKTLEQNTARSHGEIVHLMSNFGPTTTQSNLLRSQNIVEKLNELANNPNVDPKQKQDRLREILSDSLSDRQIKMWNNSPLNRIITTALEEVNNTTLRSDPHKRLT